MTPELFENNKDKKWYRKLRNKYRLVIMNDETFEERLSFRLSRLNVFIVVGSIGIILIVGVAYIIAFTPLREYIPGYTDVTVQKRTYDNMLKADSIEKAFNYYDWYIHNIKNVIEGKFDDQVIEYDSEKTTNYENISIKRSVEDSLLRVEIESQDKYNLIYSDNETDEFQTTKTAISSFHFFTPLKGIIINPFNPKGKHYGVDIVAKKNEAIKATLDGTVIFSSWTLETGYVIGIQHQHNLISVYKHNSVLLKKQGAFVKASEVIAVIGETGELSTGPHLHFELWFNGNPVNPRDYITF